MNSIVTNIRLRGRLVPGEEKVLTPEALRFVAELQREFGDARTKNLEWRQVVQKRLNAGDLSNLSFGNTLHNDSIRASEWKVALAPPDLLCRKVEITGPASVRKMVINALNSGANCYMADAEDSDSPTWENIVNGQINLYDAIRRQIDFTDPKSGKGYKLDEKTAVLFFRPRGWHLEDKHILVDGRPISASLFDFGMYFYHNAQALTNKGTGVYLYHPKMESYMEAMLWDSVFRWSEDKLELPRGTIRATVLVETLPAAFQMEEILYALREHSGGLNAARWDYIFSYIKKLSAHPEFLLPDPFKMKMDEGFLAPYCNLIVQTCHKRGAHAIGGMAAQSPSKDEAINHQNDLKVKADAAREVKLGFDGKWVSHPAYVAVAREVFDLEISGSNQLHVLREEVRVTAEDLLRPPKGVIQGESIYGCVRLSIQYLDAWLRGIGCVALENLMQDVAMVEIFRSALWQWRTHGAVLYSMVPGNYPRFTSEGLDAAIKEVMRDLRGGRFKLAEQIFRKMVFAKEFPEFLTLEAYDHILSLCGEK